VNLPCVCENKESNSEGAILEAQLRSMLKPTKNKVGTWGKGERDGGGGNCQGEDPYSFWREVEIALPKDGPC